LTACGSFCPVDEQDPGTSKSNAISEATPISRQGYGYTGAPGIYDDTQIEGWHAITSAVHAQGGKIVLQLWHVGRQSHPDLQPNGEPPVAPSAIAAEGYGYPDPFNLISDRGRHEPAHPDHKQSYEPPREFRRLYRGIG
jgi:NADH:flavin oxidoreductase / NADH oxidase family